MYRRSRKGLQTASAKGAPVTDQGTCVHECLTISDCGVYCVCRVSMEGLTSDVTALTSKVKAITEQIGRAGEDFQKQMAAFLKVSAKVCRQQLVLSNHGGLAGGARFSFFPFCRGNLCLCQPVSFCPIPCPGCLNVKKKKKTCYLLLTYHFLCVKTNMLLTTDIPFSVFSPQHQRCEFYSHFAF